MIDPTDIKILRALSSDGRMSYADLAERIHLSQTPTLRRVRRIEREGYITGYRAVLNEEKLGGAMIVFVSVSLSNQKMESHLDFRAFAEESPEVMDCILTSGDSDYLLRVAVDSLAEYELFLTQKLSTVASIAKSRSSFSLRSITNKTTPPGLMSA